MSLIGNFFPLFLIIIIALGLWVFYDATRFTRPEGKIKRGVKVWSEPISWETCQFLETLPPLTRHNSDFIRIEGREVLISQERSFWQVGRRRRQIPYVAYVNLSAPENRIEFRMPLSTSASLVFATFVILIFLVNFFSIFRDGFRPAIGYLFPILFLVFFFSSLLYNHYRERRRLLNILDQAMRGQSN